MNQQNLLSQLKDIHQPDPVSWWPPAPGWYVLIALILLAGFLIGRIIYKSWRKKQRKKHAIQSFKKLQRAYFSEPDNQYIAQAAVLLKRIVMTKYSRKQVASLSGEKWLAFLDSISNCQDYSSGAGRMLLTLPYQNQLPEDIQPEILFGLMEKTMKRCL